MKEDKYLENGPCSIKATETKEKEDYQDEKVWFIFQIAIHIICRTHSLKPIVIIISSITYCIRPIRPIIIHIFVTGT